jgi:hypothetical protein
MRTTPTTARCSADTLTLNDLLVVTQNAGQQEDTRPGRVSSVRNMETPSRSGDVCLGIIGKPTVRRVGFLGGNRTPKKRSAPRGALSYPRRTKEKQSYRTVLWQYDDARGIMAM